MSYSAISVTPSKYAGSSSVDNTAAGVEDGSAAAFGADFGASAGVAEDGVGDDAGAGAGAGADPSTPVSNTDAFRQAARASAQAAQNKLNKMKSAWRRLSSSSAGGRPGQMLKGP